MRIKRSCVRRKEKNHRFIYIKVKDRRIYQANLMGNKALEVEIKEIYQVIHLGRAHLSILDLSRNWSVVDLFLSVTGRSRSLRA